MENNKFNITNSKFDFSNPEENWLIVPKNNKLFIPQKYTFNGTFGFFFNYYSLSIFNKGSNVFIDGFSDDEMIEFIMIYLFMDKKIYLTHENKIKYIQIQTKMNKKLNLHHKNKFYDIIISPIFIHSIKMNHFGIFISNKYFKNLFYLGNIQNKLYFYMNIHELLSKKLILTSYKLNSNSIYYQNQYKYIDWKKSKPSDLETLIFRTHDYFYDINKFISKIKQFKNLINPIDTIIWNLNKKYLLELEENGVKIISTYIYNDIEILLTFKNKIIIKPLIGGGSYNVYQFDSPKNKKDLNKIHKKLYEGKYPYEIDEYFIVQPYMDGIKDGEISLIFFQTGYYISYIKIQDTSIMKYDAREIRIYEPSIELIEIASNVLKKSKKKYKYARLDFLLQDGEYYLMELEFIDPNLFFQDDNLQIITTLVDLDY